MLDRILRAKTFYVRSTGRNANFLYVGDDEYNQLKETNAMTFRLTNTLANSAGDYFVHGLKVMHVLTNSHFKITS